MTLFEVQPIETGSTNTNTDCLRRFWELDREIAEWYETKPYKEIFHSFEFALMNTTAKGLLRKLNIIS